MRGIHITWHGRLLAYSLVALTMLALVAVAAGPAIVEAG